MGFSVEEIYRTYRNGDLIAAIKMLRVETDCGLKEAKDAIEAGTVAHMSTFAEREAAKRIHDAAPDLLAALEETVAAYWAKNTDGTEGDGGEPPAVIVRACVAIAKAKGE